ncbi:serine O-acetyltransferase [Gilvimarinus agarilyticus]|uniref:serine O-acetyltransferase n=1 Tax=Gilvimarinus sp. 2_MG-2023 TaxID=3062666 RepID=UPI001C0A17BB|nr:MULTISPECIES: serine O-acetyltransferase [unclassified Gilvimarinus]MBU2886119.1 serine O-acetyltransferase [Gilvimarinus agarilyticus]MDO6570829.1 serine O-acetyltransferase [Gilvimarinus sp. 2_MG-2023]MDO6746997.1 serine O-acetyltransferase [Gilvimarinus sp. 1_MG-2023]
MLQPVVTPATIWQQIRSEAHQLADVEPALASFYHASILNHTTLADTVSFHMANLLDSQALPSISLREVFSQALGADSRIELALCRDIEAYCERDPACDQFLMPLLYFKGFHALLAYRFSHWLWGQDRHCLALYLQNRISQAFGVDIHPAAQLGSGIMIDHATGVVIGETAVVGDDVSMLHAVTLGGSGNDKGHRHPTIGRGVLIAAGAKILGNITVGEGAKIGAGSVVLEAVPAHTTAVGVPAKIVGRPSSESPAQDMNHTFDQ